jgi:four helix bundle protein
MQNEIAPRNTQGIRRAKSKLPHDEHSDLKGRTKNFALRIIRMFAALPRTELARVIGRQVLRSGTSVGAQYREACRARTPSEFVSKLASALQELDETAYWLDLLVQSRTVSTNRMAELQKETEELISMFVASIRTAKLRKGLK